ncbi:hypothetical protein H4R33_004226 [Dimargaris cristalligena]|uniref:Uncharacterized protein n=1 Tax=Dimargaris cristalligena TaxID=215637 RepID=A0A4P9ZS94_9FUNG|nr:hypothetical protein H4R33_004226 [Dimargaris cristalligena]RKP35661.1 hypothetical protein BJ085DRAFT_32499 [Dimargaris cristalligena]|eukprot:RKP35661.1 hypothetical protein BJ085DRAFT_32499 [Dimargaris cristalligena]
MRFITSLSLVLCLAASFLTLACATSTHSRGSSAIPPPSQLVRRSPAVKKGGAENYGLAHPDARKTIKARSVENLVKNYKGNPQTDTKKAPVNNGGAKPTPPSSKPAANRAAGGSNVAAGSTKKGGTPAKKSWSNPTRGEIQKVAAGGSIR